MLRPNLPSYNDIDITNDLFEQLSISLDSSNNKFLRHKHITSKPKLKRLLKLKSSCFNDTSPANLAFCTRCKKETLVVSNVGGIEKDHITEKEVEVKKDLIVRASEKKVQFINKDDFGSNDDVKEKADKKKVTPEYYTNQAEEDGSYELTKNDGEEVGLSTLSESETVSVHFQSVFFASRPSIIGNNEFWLPKYSSSDVTKETGKSSQEAISEPAEISTQSPDGEEIQEEGRTLTVKTSGATSITSNLEVSLVQDNSMLTSLTVFLNNIFAQTSKKRVKILQVAVMLDGTVATLTDEHFFKCKHVGTTYEIIDAISLKDVQKIMVSDTCALLVLEVRHSSSLTERKEFVPGYSEKTESLISLMVYAISRIKNILLDVIRLPLLSLPTCEAMLVWLDRQNEDIMYTGIATAENISNPDYENLSEESFMMKIGGRNQFHPVMLLIRAGYLTSKCNGGCAPRGCKYSVTLELRKEKVNVMRREDKPWPNCVRLITECMDITFASSRKSSADDLVEKLYSSMQTTEKSSLNIQAFVLVTEHSLQLFTMNVEKAPLFGSPLLNLDIFDEDVAGMTCIIDSQGTEVADLENLQTQSRWHLTFLNDDEKLKFLTATTVE